MKHKNFVAGPKGMLIAPAGYGKTYAIVECLSYTEGKQLILTHTHAGIASIKEKIKKANVASAKYHIETITGYAQKYVHAYNFGKPPDRNDTDAYYSFLISVATNIIKRPIVMRSISITYTGLFVDEYQDCTLAQHKFVCELANILPTRILGDPLQGIFEFNGEEMVNLDDTVQMEGFQKNSHILEEPWRWKGKNDALGESLKNIRAQMLSRAQIDLRSYPAIELVSIIDPNDIYNPQKPYYQKISKLLSENNLLLIHPVSHSINARLKIIASFRVPIAMIESIDDKDFYALAKLVDSASLGAIGKVSIDLCRRLFNKTGVKLWFNDKGLINKQAVKDKLISNGIRSKFNEINSKGSYSAVSNFIKHVSELETIRCYRKELLSSICNALHDAELNNKSAYDSMVDRRNHIRRIGRRVYGKCIGTTLLTKGLEFDTVVILNAQDYKCPKNLYVALTRASKRLIVFTTNHLLMPEY